MPLVTSITSKYFEAANRLASKKSRRRVIAYVESYDDIFFWRTLLSMHEDDQHFYEVLLPTKHGHIGRGKMCVLKMIETNSVGKDMIACVDADYDYLAQGLTNHSRQMLQTPYVYHTHAYAIENWQCWAPSLHQVAVMVTLNDKHIFDYERYLTDYSLAVYPLFVWSVWLYRTENNKTMSLRDMDHLITPGHFIIENPAKSIHPVIKRVAEKVEELETQFPEFNEQSQQLLISELSQLGVKPEDCYLFIHGHHIFEKVVTPMLTCVCKKLRQMRENDIRSQAVHQKQLNAELAGYTHATEAVENMLRKNTAWLAATTIQQILL